MGPSRSRRIPLVAGVLAVIALAAVMLIEPALHQGRTVAPQPDRAGSSSEPRTEGDGLALLPARPARREVSARSDGPTLTQPHDERGLRLYGDVETEHGTPVAGAAITVRASGASPPAETTSGPDGRFAIVLSPAPALANVSITARGGDKAIGSTALRVMPTSARDLYCGTIRLRPVAVLRVVALRDGVAQAGARIHVAHHGPDPLHLRASSGDAWGEAVVTDGRGEAQVEVVDRSRVRVLALAARARGEVTLTDVARAQQPVRIELQGTRSVRVTVGWAESGEAIPDVLVDMVHEDGRRLDGPSGLAVTDENGVAVVTGVPESESMYVRAMHPEWTWPRRNGPENRLGARLQTVELLVPRPITVRWPLVPGDGPIPEDGEVVEVESYDRITSFGGVVSRQAAIDGGHLVLDALYETWLTASARVPDGRVAWLELPGEWRLPPAPVAFRNAGQLEVTVRDTTDSPVPGILVRVHQHGRGRGLAKGLTDDQGRVLFSRLPPSTVVAKVAANPTIGEHDRVGTFAPYEIVDLSDGKEAVVFVVAPEEKAEIRVLDGGAPPTRPFELVVGIEEETLTWRAPSRSVWRFEEGLVSFPIRRPEGQRVGVRVSARGRVAETVYLFEGADVQFPITVNLRRAGSILARIVFPQDGLASVRIERQSEDGRWKAVGGLFPRQEAGARVEHLFEGLLPGTHRLRDGYSGLASSAVHVGASEDLQSPELALDLSRAGAVEGSLELPFGESAWGALVRIEGAGVKFDDVELSSSDRSIGRVRPDGCFSVRVPGDRVVTLHAEHPRCIPDPEHGRVSVLEPVPGLLLRLVRPEEK